MGTGAVSLTGGVTSGGVTLSGGAPTSGGCDGASCLAGAENGQACSIDGECRSGHCGGGICCEAGTCCLEVKDCGDEQRACDDTSTCQGWRRAWACTGFVCAAGPKIEDDTACGPASVADTCDAFADARCAGSAAQQKPVCADRCDDDSFCDADAHCAGGSCVRDVPDGGMCTENIDCASEHCQGGVCCADGDCCQTATDCPDSYGQPPACGMPSLCQGSRVDPICTAQFVCATGPIVEDDSACTSDIVADDCMTAQDYRCNGDVDQPEAQCRLLCGSDAGCDLAAHCAPVGSNRSICLPDVADGEACTRDAQCLSNHCNNGYCCASGDCCATASDCPAEYGWPPVCINVPICDGRRGDPICDANFRCQKLPASIADPAGCAGEIARTCGAYADVVCDGTQSQQTALQQGTLTCSFSCTTDIDCDPDASCVSMGNGGVRTCQ